MLSHSDIFFFYVLAPFGNCKSLVCNIEAFIFAWLFESRLKHRKDCSLSISFRNGTNSVCACKEAYGEQYQELYQLSRKCIMCSRRILCLENYTVPLHR